MERQSSQTECGPERTAGLVEATWKNLLRAGQDCWAVLIPLLLVFWTYRGALHGDFVFDDIGAIVENRAVESLGGVWDAAFGSRHTAVSNRPLVCLSLALNHAISGRNTFGYHLFNLAMHGANVALLWAVLRRVLAIKGGPTFGGRGATWTATAVAALWAVHPLTVEAVVYITQRSTLMMGFFLLSMLYASLRVADDERARVWRIVTSCACALAMLCKEEAVAAPILLVLFDRAFLFDSFRTAWKRRAGMYAGAAASWVLLIACVALGPKNPTVGYRTIPQASAIEWLMTQATVIVHYVRLAYWPRPLSAAYAWDIVRDIRVAVWPGLVVVGILGVAVAAWAWRPHWGWLGAWFFLLLAPTSSVMPIVSEVVAERRMYLPMLALLIPPALGLMCLGAAAARACCGNSRWSMAWAALPLAAVTCLAASDAARHARVFDSEKALWTDAYQKNQPLDGGFLDGMILSGFSSVLIREQRSDLAVPLLRQAVACEPPRVESIANLAAALADLGPRYYAEAERLHREALEHEPDQPIWLMNFAKLRLDEYQSDSREKQLGIEDPRLLEAQALLRRSFQIEPRNSECLNKLGLVSFYRGRLQEAESAWVAALELDPANVGPATNRAMMLAATGRLPEAATQFEQLLRTRPQNVAALLNLALCHMKMGNPDAALRRVREALAIEPTNVTAQQLLQTLTAPAIGPGARG